MAFHVGDRFVNIVLTLATIGAACGPLFGVSALRCHHCGWDTCGTHEELIECSLERVNQVHEHLQRLVNLTQYKEPPTPEEFACFELQLTNVHGNRSGTVKSCTFQSAKMCELTDWKSVRVVGCNTCNDRDFCNGFKSVLPAKIDTGAGFSFSSYSSSASAISRSGSSFRIWYLALTVLFVTFIHRLPSNGE